MDKIFHNAKCQNIHVSAVIKCAQCGLDHDSSFAGKRCLRCNKVLQLDICKNCKGCNR